MPLQISDDDIKNSSCYRTRNRIPTLCWYDKVHKSSIWRSSQTKCGITQQRNSCDELLLKHIAETSIKGKITIFDTRPYLTALYNKVIKIIFIFFRLKAQDLKIPIIILIQK